MLSSFLRELPASSSSYKKDFRLIKMDNFGFSKVNKILRNRSSCKCFHAFVVQTLGTGNVAVSQEIKTPYN